MLEMPYGDPAGMRSLAGRLWVLADRVAIEGKAPWHGLRDLTFEAPVATWYRDRGSHRAHRAEASAVALRELAGFLRRAAHTLEDRQEQVRRHNAAEQARRDEEARFRREVENSGRP